MTAKSFVRVQWTVFEKTEKVQKWPFFDQIVLIFAIFLRSQSFDSAGIVHAGAPSEKLYGQFFLKFSENFFSTPKNVWGGGGVL